MNESINLKYGDSLIKELLLKEAGNKNSFDELTKTWTNPECINDFKRALVETLKLGTNEISINTFQGKEYLDFVVEGRGWTFTPRSFELQAHFIHAWETSGKKIDSTINIILETMGYIAGSDWRTKYLTPFFSMDEGLQIIEREIMAVHKVWEMMEY